MTSRSIYANKRHLEKSRPMLCWKILWQILFSVFKLGSRIYIESGLSAMGFHLWTRTGLKRSYPRMCILYPNVCVEKRMKVVSAHKEQHNWMKEKACIKMIPSLTARHIESWILSDYCNPFLLMCWSHSHVARKTNRVFFFFFPSATSGGEHVISPLWLGSTCTSTYHPFAPGEGSEWLLD